MLEVARSMASSNDTWANAPVQLVSSRLEQGAARLGSTPSSSIDSTTSLTSKPRLERAESFMSTASASSAIFAAATITKASTATIRKLEPTDASAKPIRFTKSRQDQEPITPSSSIEHMSSRSTDVTEYPTSPTSAADHSHTTVTTSFDTTIRTPEDHSHNTFEKFGTASHANITLGLAEPTSFFSDSLSEDESNRSMSATTSRLNTLESERLGIASTSVSRRSSDNANSELAASDMYNSTMPHSSSYQSAISSFANPAESLPHAYRTARNAAQSSSTTYNNKPAAGAKFGLGIQTKGPPPSQMAPLTEPSLAARFLTGPALEVVPEARESPYLGSRASQTASTPDLGAPSALTITTALPLNTEPVWGESSSAIASTTADPTLGAMASFAFPSPALSSAGLPSTTSKSTQSRSLSARFPRSPGSAFHSSNPSIQSSTSNMNARQPFSSNRNDAGLLQASTWSHAPPSSFGGSVVSSIAGTSVAGFSSLGPTNREDMLQRLLLDQARVDSQEYGTLSLEEVAEAKRDLKHVERKVQSLRTKLKVEIKIRDAAVALRRAHRTTAASAHSPTSSVHLVVSPTSPRFPNMQSATGTLASSTSTSSSSSSFAARSRAVSISASEAKADEDVAIATAKVDKVANELFKWSERATTLRRKLLEHQAATLSERVQLLESDRQVVEEKQPFLTTSTSFESLAPSASASAVGINRYRDAGHLYQQSADEPYIPRGPEDSLRHNRLESDLSAISGFSFLDATAPEKLRRLGEEVQKKRELVRKLEMDLDAARDAARRKDQTSDRLTQQLEEQSRERSRAIEELRALQQQLRRQDELALQAQEQAVKAATAEVEQRMQRQIEQSRSRDQEKEDALVNAKAEVMAGQRALVDVQSRLRASEDQSRSLQIRAEAAERALEEHKRKLDDVQGESTRQLTQGSQDLASLQAELVTAKAAQEKMGNLAAERAKAIAELEKQSQEARSTFDADKQKMVADHATAIADLSKQLEQVRSDLSAETRTRTAVEGELSACKKEIIETQGRADQADSKLRELELAVGAERRIMAERDELFHAFERRLESAEKRLQEQDKRCARMLGKLEGREEMDDLLERIKAGAAGIAKKTKTAGQDIAGLLSSLETHIGDLELELARANAQISGSPRDSTAASDARETTSDEGQLEASIQEVGKWKAEAERLEELLQSEKNRKTEVPAQDQQDKKRLQELEAQVLTLSEQNKGVKLEEEGRRAQLEADMQELSQKYEELQRQGKERVAELEQKLERLEGRNRELEKQLCNASNLASPAASIDSLPLRSSKVASPRSATFAPQNKGVNNLIDRFGDGRKVSSELRADDSPAAMIACMRSVENLRAMLPDLPAAAKGSADLHALRDAFQASNVAPTSPSAAKSPTSARAVFGAAGLQAELDATAERLRSTLAISRAVIDLALEAETDKENLGPSEGGKQPLAASRTQADALSSQQALVTRITSLTVKVKEQTEREKRLKAEVGELRQQLEEAQNHERVPSSPYGLTLGNDSMLGLSTSPARPGETVDFLSMPKSIGRTSSNKSMRSLMMDRAVPIPTSGASLAPPRSPNCADGMPSPTRSNVSGYSSPSIRYISPFAPSSFEARTPQKSAAELRSAGADNGAGNVSLSNASMSNVPETWDSMSLRSVSSPSSTHVGLPSSAASVKSTSQSASQTSALVQRAAADPSASTGMVKRTITLGMDVPQLVSRVRELERQLEQTASIRQRAERATELETQLREANQAYTKLLDRLDAERHVGTHQKVEILNELNDAHSKLQTTQAQIQLARSVSPAPLVPPKDEIRA